MIGDLMLNITDKTEVINVNEVVDQPPIYLNYDTVLFEESGQF